MTRAFFIALLVISSLAFAKDARKKRKAAPTAAQVQHPFADVPVAKLSVSDTRNGQGLVQTKDGETVLVRAGDLLGSEGLKVEKITRGCVVLSGDIKLCADVPEVPRT